MIKNLAYRRIVRDRETKEEKIITDTVRVKHVQCLYQDQYGVFIIMDNGQMIKTAHTLNELNQYINHPERLHPIERQQ